MTIHHPTAAADVQAAGADPQRVSGAAVEPRQGLRATEALPPEEIARACDALAEAIMERGKPIGGVAHDVAATSVSCAAGLLRTLWTRVNGDWALRMELESALRVAEADGIRAFADWLGQHHAFRYEQDAEHFIAYRASRSPQSETREEPV
jgi:hypothetical protein